MKRDSAKLASAICALWVPNSFYLPSEMPTKSSFQLTRENDIQEWKQEPNAPNKHAWKLKIQKQGLRLNGNGDICALWVGYLMLFLIC